MHDGLLATVLGLTLLAGGMVRADEAAPRPIVLPPGNAVQLTVGGARRFSATVTEANVEYRWTVDGERVGTERAFEYVPGSGDIGAHEVAVTVLSGSAATRHVWRVTVEPPPVPTIADVAPATAVVRAQPGERVGFRYVVTSSVATDQVAVVWTVDGVRAGEGSAYTVEVEAGEPKRVRAVASSALGVVQAREWRLVAVGPAVAAGPAPGEVEPDEELTALLRTMKPERRTRDTVPAARPTTTVRVAAVTTTSAVRVAVLRTTSTAPVATTSTVPVVTTSTAPRPTTSVAPIARPTTTRVVSVPTTSTTARRLPAPTTTVVPAELPPSTVVVARAAPPSTAPPTTIPPSRRPPTTIVAAIPPAPPPTVPPAPPAVRTGIAREEVVAFLERYARAYESRSVGDLQRIGQITGTKQAEALGRYFEQVRDLRVDVRVLDIEPRGNDARVRYQRRDRFRDPTGRVVDKETPPIEKVIRRTPSGLVFTPAS